MSASSTAPQELNPEDWVHLPQELLVLIARAAVGTGATRAVCRTFRDAVDAATEQLHIPVQPQPISKPHPRPVSEVSAASTCVLGLQHVTGPSIRPMQLRLHRFPRLRELSVRMPGQGGRLLLDLSDCPATLSALSVIGDRYHQHSMRSPSALPELHNLVLKNVLVVADAPPAPTNITPTAASAVGMSDQEVSGAFMAQAVDQAAPGTSQQADHTGTAAGTSVTVQQQQHAAAAGAAVSAAAPSEAAASTAAAASAATGAAVAGQMTMPRRFHRRGRTAPAVRLELSAVPGLRSLVCWSRSVTVIDLSPVTLLTELVIGEMNLTELNLECTPHLTKLVCTDTNISELDLNHTHRLAHLNVHATDMRTLDLRPCAASLVRLRASNCMRLTQLSLEGLSQLEFLDVAATGITTLDLRHVPRLTALDCGLSSISHIQLAHLPSLTALQISDSNITSLDLSHVPHLRALFACACRVSHFGDLFSHCPQLETVRLTDSAASHLNLLPAANLLRLDTTGSRIKRLDLSGGAAPRLQQLHTAPSARVTGLEEHPHLVLKDLGVVEIQVQEEGQQQGQGAGNKPSGGASDPADPAAECGAAAGGGGAAGTSAAGSDVHGSSTLAAGGSTHAAGSSAPGVGTPVRTHAAATAAPAGAQGSGPATAPAVTGPAVSGPAVTGPDVTGPAGGELTALGAGPRPATAAGLSSEGIGYKGRLLAPWQWSWLYGLVLDMDIDDALAALDDPRLT